MVLKVCCDNCKKELYEVALQKADSMSFYGVKHFCETCEKLLSENKEEIRILE